MENTIYNIIHLINIHVLPLFILYVILRSSYVYTMLLHEITTRQALLIVLFSLLALQVIHWGDPHDELLQLNSTATSISILCGMLFGHFTGTVIGLLSAWTVFLHGHEHPLAIWLVLFLAPTVSGFMSERYKKTATTVWDNNHAALLVALSLFLASSVVVTLVIVTTEPERALLDVLYFTIWKLLSFGILFFLVQTFITERANINSCDALAGEMRFARKLQLDIVSHQTSVVTDPRVQIYGTLHPAKDVGGDWYDYFMLNEDKLCLVMGDVSGKGVPAALFMVVGCMLFRAFKDDALDATPATLLELVNNDLCEDNPAKMFITAVCAILDIKTGELLYSNVGHTTAYIKKADGTLLDLPVTNKGVLGFFSNKKYQNRSIQLQANDVFLTYTDGVTEAQNTTKELFGSQRLENLLKKPYHTVETLCENIMIAVNDFSADIEQSDDITLLAVRFDQFDCEKLL